MKILCLYSSCAPAYVRDGWRKVFELCGHEFIFWDNSKKSAFDIFDEVEPDIFIGTTYDTDKAIIKCLLNRPNLRSIMFASSWGSLTDKIDREKYPIDIASDQEKKNIEFLKKEINQPEYVFIHHNDTYLTETMNHWNNIGIKPISLLMAADTFDYYPAKQKEELICDLGFVGGYWKYKSENINKYLIPLCYPGNNKQYNIKIFGNQAWPVHQYLGHINTNLVKHLFNSATICPNISEPHSTDFGYDIVERPFKILSSKGFCISDYVESMEKDIFLDSVPLAKTPKDFMDLINHFMEHPEERSKYIDKGYTIVRKGHTYFHRVAKMLKELNMINESEQIIQKGLSMEHILE